MIQKVVLNMHDVKALTSVAMLETLWEVKRQDMIDIVTPFTKYAIAHTTRINAPIDVSQVASYVKREFGYAEFPQGVVEKVLKRISPEYVKREHGVYYLKVSLDDECEKLDKKRVECVEHIDAISMSLVQYLDSHCKRRYKGTKEETAEHLQAFFGRYGLYIGANPYKLESISPEKYEIDYYIAQFIFENERNSTKEYYYIIDLIKGYYLSTVIYLQPNNGNILSAGYRKVSFFYDTPVLLRLLGYHSVEEQTATMELHNLLKKQGGTFGFFPQTEDEIRSILTAYQHALTSKRSAWTLEGLDALRYNSDGVERLKKTFTTRLETFPDLQVKKVPLPPYPQNSDGTVDADAITVSEEDVKTYIRAEVGHYKDDSLEADVASALAIERLRKRSTVHNLEECEAVFVTTNRDFARAFNTYYTNNVLADGFPLVISDVDLSAIAWVKSNSYDNAIPRQQLLANAYMAMQPLPQLMERFKDVVTQLCREGLITEEEAYILRSEYYIAKDLNLSTMGNVELVNATLVGEIHQRYKDKVLANYEEKRRMEAELQRRKRIAEAIEKAHREAENEKNKYARNRLLAAKGISLLVAIACIAMTIKTWMNIPLTIIFAIFAVISIMSVVDTIRAKEKKVEKLILRFANAVETKAFEKKKKEYFDVLGITEADLELLPKTE